MSSDWERGPDRETLSPHSSSAQTNVRNRTQPHMRPVLPHSHLQLGKLRHTEAKAHGPYHSANKGPSQDSSQCVKGPST